MSENKVGKLTYIAKGDAKGVHLDDNKDIWYNPTKECKDLVGNDLLGKTVELTMVEGKNKFSYIKAVLPESNGVPKQKPTSSYNGDIRLQNASHCFSRLHVGKQVEPKDAAKWCRDFVAELYKE